MVVCSYILFLHRGQPGIPFDLQLHRLASVFFIPSFDRGGALYPIHNPGWTLNYEMLFYLCFMLVLILGRHLAFVKLAAIICLLFLIGLAAPNSIIRTFLGTPIIFEFLIGAALGFSAASWRSAVRWPWAWILLSVGLLLLFHRCGFGMGQRLLAYGVPATTLFVGFVALENSVRWPRLAVLLGDASYSIYLVHTLVIYRVTSKISYLNTDGFSQLSTITVSLAAIATAVIVGLLFHRTVERPVTQMCHTAYNRLVKQA